MIFLLRDVSILSDRSLSSIYIYIYILDILLFLELKNSVLKSLSEEMYRVIGDQTICSSNLCWPRRIYIIDCASFVLSVLSIIMNVAEDRCVSLCLEAWLFRFSCRRSCAVWRLLCAGDRGGYCWQSRINCEMRAALYPCARSSARTAASVGLTTFSACTFF